VVAQLPFSNFFQNILDYIIDTAATSRVATRCSDPDELINLPPSWSLPPIMARFSATSTPSTSRSRTLTTKLNSRLGPGSIVDIAGRKLKLSPVIDTLFQWMAERHAIHQRRLTGRPWPWTDDPILQQHNFTNVFRIYDRVTQYIICNVIGEGDQDFHETCFRVILFRCFNRISTWELLLAHFGELMWRNFDLAAYESVLYEEYRRNNKLYGSAYILPAPELGGTSLDGSKGKANYANHLRLLKVMMETDLPGQLAQLSELSDAWERISMYPSMGAFLSFQYVSPFPTYRPFYRLTCTDSFLIST
jgi:5-hmdU DNA kinase-like protein